ncbi:MAG: DUF192 domain-containing protein [Myxococcota bacterium]
MHGPSSAIGGLWGVFALFGCGEPSLLACLESDPNLSAGNRVELTVADSEISAELATTEEQRATAWAGRTCDLEGLLWVPDAVGPAAITLCDVQLAVDLVFVRESTVVAVELERAPCAQACDACPVYGATGPDVDAVLWLPAGLFEVAVGDSIVGLDAVVLPSAGDDDA